MKSRIQLRILLGLIGIILASCDSEPVVQPNDTPNGFDKVTITGLTPGRVFQGEETTIAGWNFPDSVMVLVSGSPQALTHSSHSQLRFRPTLSPGRHIVAMVAGDDTLQIADTLYIRRDIRITSLLPDPIDRGDTLRVGSPDLGSVSNQVALTIGGIPQQILAIAGDQLVARIGDDAISGEVSITDGHDLTKIPPRVEVRSPIFDTFSLQIEGLPVDGWKKREDGERSYDTSYVWDAQIFAWLPFNSMSGASHLFCSDQGCASTSAKIDVFRDRLRLRYQVDLQGTTGGQYPEEYRNSVLIETGMIPYRKLSDKLIEAEIEGDSVSSVILKYFTSSWYNGYFRNDPDGEGRETGPLGYSPKGKLRIRLSRK